MLFLSSGGGIGLVYGFLKQKGFNIYSIEPSGPGFEGHYQTALEILNALNVDSSHYLPHVAAETSKLSTKFDIIFSNSVLEHILDLESTFHALINVLKPHGIMIHYTDNYTVPYDPHFKILLIPFFPRTTAFFKRELRASALWSGLNFITVGKLKRLAKQYNVDIIFEKGLLLETFQRLEKDKAFTERQKHFLPLYQFLKRTRLIHIFPFIPAELTTPIRFTIQHKPKSRKPPQP